MKKTTLTARSVLPLFLLFLLSFLPARLLAQMSWPAAAPSTFELGYAASACAANEVVNTDLYNYYPSTTPEQFLAIVYDGGWMSGTVVNLLVYDNQTGVAIQTPITTSGSRPDVAIADNPSSPGNLIVSVVYESGGNVYYDAYDVSGLGTSTLSCIQRIGYPVQLNASPGTQWPHIDKAPDPTATPVYGTIFPLHYYAITWAEWNGGNFDIVALGGNISTLPGASPPTQLIAQGDKADVALNVNTALPYTRTAYFIYYDPLVSDVKHADWDFVNPPNNGYPSVDPGVIGIADCPRIDAANLTTAAIQATDVNWQAVAEIMGGSGLQEIHAYDNTGGAINTVDYSALTFTGNPLTTGNGRSPAVGCGNGAATAGSTTDIGNTTYTMGWHIDAPAGGENFYAVSVDITGLGPTGYSRVPMLSPVNNFSFSIAPAFAVANGSNDGYELVTAWYNWTAVYWKFSGNAFAFKTTSAEGRYDFRKPNLYPNPAKGHLTLENMKNSSYTITNMAGITLQQGKIDNNPSYLNIEALAAGLYFINVHDGAEATTLKFVKE